MGVFTLLETPTLNRVAYVDDLPFTNTHGCFPKDNVPKVYQYQLAKDLEYAINPAAGLTLTDIKATYVISYVAADIYPSNTHDTFKDNDFFQPTDHPVNFVLSNSSYATGWFPQPYIETTKWGSTVIESFTQSGYSTDIYPILYPDGGPVQVSTGY